MNCIYCGKKLPMVKKFTSEEFCSVAHRQAYQHEQEQLAIARLLEDQNRRKPIRKQIQNQPKEKDQVPESGGYLAEPIAARPMKSRPWHAQLDLLVAAKAAQLESNSNIAGVRAGLADAENSSSIVSALDTSSVEGSMAALLQAEVPSTLSALDFCTSSYAGPPVTEVLANTSIGVLISTERPSDPVFNPIAIESPGEALLPNSNFGPQQVVHPDSFDLTHAAGQQLPFDLSRTCLAVTPGSAAAPSGYGSSLSAPNCNAPNYSGPNYNGPNSDAADPSDTGARASADRQKPLLSKSNPSRRHLLSVPMATSVRSSSGPALAAFKPLSRSFAQPLAYLPNFTEVLDPGAHLRGLAAPAVVCYAGSIQRLFSRPRPNVPRPASLAPANERPQPLAAAQIPSHSQSANVLLGRTLGKCEPFGGLMHYPESFFHSVAGKWAAVETLLVFDQPFHPKARIAIVRRSSISLNADAVRISRQAKIKVRPEPGLLNPVMYECEDPQQLSVLKPHLNLPILPAHASNSAFEALSAFSSGGHAISWTAVQRHWRDAPNDLRWIALAVPLILGLIWFADSPSAQDGAKGRIASMVPNIGNPFKVSFSGDSLEGIKQNIQRRAAVELSDDFRQGLGEWAGAGDWARGWSYDSAGFLRPRKLALFTPSLSLEDYRFEFLAAIERRALSWVVRAADIKNYYAYRLEITRGGPLPEVELVRYSVINGRAGSRKSIPLHLQARLDTIYRIRMDVSGSDVVTTIQGQVVDVFSDDKLTRGGVGFFSEAGEDSRLRWIEVSHQYDMLGRLCAYLVPYNVSNSNVRSAP